MPRAEYKPESFAAQMARLWRENNGNWLLATGLIVSLLAYMIGYFNLVPEFSAVRRPNSSIGSSGGKSLTVNIVGCSSDQGQVIAMLYDAVTFSESSVATHLEALPVIDRQATWRISNLPFGKYAVYAFQDLDGDEVVDPEKERQGISITNSAIPTGENTSFGFSSAAFEFSPVNDEITVELR